MRSGQPDLGTQGDLTVGEGFVVVCGGERDGGVIRAEGLHYDPAGVFTAARASGDLGDQLERARRGRKSGRCSGGVG
ncbi:MAG: hypothetical protein R3C45_00725 [Phycisphaerales bacterium]